VKVLAIDDNADDRQRLENSLLGKRGVQCRVIPPPAVLDARELAKYRPDVAVIDYQLTERETGREPATFKGSTLAAALREKLPGVPIVLTTRQRMLGTGGFASARDLSDAFDELIVKEDIHANSVQFVTTLGGLAKGFKLLREAHPRNRKSLQGLLRSSDLEREELLRADPPQELLSDGSWRVPEVARWIREVLLKYPGIIYDSLHASVALGLECDSFLRPSVQTFFKTAIYKGVFAGSGPHFWKTRMLTRARALLRESGLPDAPFTDFAKAWRRARRVDLPQAICNNSGKSPADSVCFVLRESVLRRYSLPYRPDTRPVVMDEARVSFKAIRTDNRYDERLFPQDARALLNTIQEGKDRL
jgi:CheY-like chemotaxis protein